MDEETIIPLADDPLAQQIEALTGLLSAADGFRDDELRKVAMGVVGAFLVKMAGPECKPPATLTPIRGGGPPKDKPL